jgi:uncharacterized membrane protein YphA (DoxX/SURF4 family)
MAATRTWNEDIADGISQKTAFIRLDTQTAPISKKRIRAGRIVSALPVLFLLFDAIMKFMNVAPVVEAQSQLGIPANLTFSIGILELLCVLFYVIPRTSFIGAILLTGYLGGATAIQLRVANPLLTHILFPTYVGALLWGGLYLRDSRLRQLISFRSVTAGRGATQATNYALWIVQGLLSLVFLFAGGTKLVLPMDVLTSMASPNQIVLPGWFLRFIGLSEVLGAIGLILPRLLRTRPVLTPLAAAGLVIIMIGATSITLASGEIVPAFIPMVVGVLSGFVAYGRWGSR